MQDKFSNEIEIVNQLRDYLTVEKWSIVQLVCSGGQAHYSVSYKKSGKTKNVYPDLVAYSGNKIIIGEVKEKFDLTDQNKLEEIKSSEDAIMKIVKVMNLRTRRSDFISSNVNFILIHSEFKKLGEATLDQLILNNGRFVFDSKNNEHL